MTNNKTETIISHPMEGVLDLPSGTTTLPAVKRQSDVTPGPSYDTKDTEIDLQFQEIYDLSLDAYELQMEESETVEGKYKARNGEVAAQYLTIALNAAKDKAMLKTNKDKINLQTQKATTGGNLTQNNIIVGDRNDILRSIMNNQEDSS